jgi:hypothetical protein
MGRLACLRRWCALLLLGKGRDGVQLGIFYRRYNGLWIARYHLLDTATSYKPPGVATASCDGGGSPALHYAPSSVTIAASVWLAVSSR